MEADRGIIGRDNIEADGSRSIFTEANLALEEALEGKVLVLWDKFASTGRNSYISPSPSSPFISNMRPEIIFCDYSIEPHYKSSTPTIFSKEERTGMRVSSEGLSYEQLLFDDLRNFIRSDSRTPIALTWFETETKRKLIGELGGRLVAMPMDVRDILEDKANFDFLLASAGISQKYRLKSNTYESAGHLPSFRDLTNTFGGTFVVQGRSMGGDGTVIVRCEQDLEEKCAVLKDRVRVSEFCPEQYFSTNVITIPDQNGCKVFVDVPAHKATNIPEVGIGEVTGAGQDWSLPYPKSISADFVEKLVQLGKYLHREYGLMGVWGVEGFLNDGIIYFNELNCRPGGDTETSSINQISMGFPPFFTLHTLAFLNGRLDWTFSDEAFNQKVIEMISNVGKKRPFYLKIKALGDAPLRRSESFFGTGVYSLTDDNSLKWLRPGLSTAQADFDEGEVLVVDAPLENTISYPGIQLCTIEGITSKNHIFEGPHSLSQNGHRIVEAIYKNFVQAR